jgi:uncharacterized protein YndB with AHSA1/START domain
MIRSIIQQLNPKLDLLFERIVDVSRESIWTAWTTAEQLKKWFTPEPWETVDCEIDLRPGGSFRTVMRSPEGQQLVNAGCYLELVENEKLVWTNALAPSYRPCKAPDAMSCVTFLFTVLIALEPEGNGTKYTALVLHSDEEARKKHEEMGFHEAWGKALDQLVELVKKT